MEWEVTIYVKQDHIDNGKPRYDNECPVALAMKDAEIKDPSVSIEEITGKYQGQWFSAYPSDDVADFIDGYDKAMEHSIDLFNEYGIAPFSFPLRMDLVPLEVWEQ